MAYETLHTLHVRKKGKKGSIALKLDINKGYDWVEWPFLQGMMQRMGFSNRWIGWAMGCVTTPSFSILINDKTYGNINPSRGICQGDPLSPYLFLLCVEGLTSLLSKVEHDGCIHGVFVCRRAPKITNLMFADNSLLLCRAIQGEVEVINEVLQVYAHASSQCINIDKSSVYFSNNTPNRQRGEIGAAMGVKHVEKF